MIGLVFQDATLLPWKNALENAAFLQMTGERSTARDIAMARARDMLRLVGLDGAEGNVPRNFRAACGSASRLRGRWRSIPKSC
jgi:ABC-type nitrate/sulfonate/bicarbonate transport system, ATPase component